MTQRECKCAAQDYLGVGESVVAHGVGVNNNGPGAGARRWRLLRLVEKMGICSREFLPGNRHLDDAKGNAQHMRIAQHKCTLKARRLQPMPWEKTAMGQALAPRAGAKGRCQLVT